MIKSNKLRGLTAAIAVSALFAAQPAAANVIELNSFWAGGSNVVFTFNGVNNGTPTSFTEGAYAGGFKTYDLTNDPSKQHAFQSFCVDIFDSFSFTSVSNDSWHPAATVITAEAAQDLGVLYTNHHAQIDATGSNGLNEAAFQLAVWEIVNEQGDGGYNLANGTFTATGAASSLASAWLGELVGTANASGYSANIWKVDSMLASGTGTGHAQDVVTFTPVPEPETYAMMLVGLGLLGFSARRKNQHLG